MSLSHWIFVLGRKLSRVQDFLLACRSFPVFPLFRRFPESIFPCVSRVKSVANPTLLKWINESPWSTWWFFSFSVVSKSDDLHPNLQDNTSGERERNSSICRALEKQLTSSKAAGHGYCPGHANECECFALEAKGLVESPLSCKFHDLWLDMPLAYLIQPLDGKQIFRCISGFEGWGLSFPRPHWLNTRGLGEDCNATSGMLGPQNLPSRSWWSWRHPNKPSLVPRLSFFLWARILWLIFRRKNRMKKVLCVVWCFQEMGQARNFSAAIQYIVNEDWRKSAPSKQTWWCKLVPGCKDLQNWLTCLDTHCSRKLTLQHIF